MRQNDLKKVSRVAPSGEADVTDLSSDIRRAEHDDSFIMKRLALEAATLVLAAALLAVAISAHPARASE